MMVLTKLWLLLWKYLYWRKHHWFLTTCEVLLPILVIFGLCKTFSVYSGGTDYDPNTGFVPGLVYNAKDVIRDSDWSLGNIIYYTPETVFTKKLMERVQIKIRATKVISQKNEGGLELILSNSTRRNWGVVFVGVEDNNTMPDKLVYKIRWLQNRFSPNVESFQDYLNFGFSALHMVVDEAFISLKWHNSMKIDYMQDGRLKFQSFPELSHEEDGNTIRWLILSALVDIVIVASIIQAFPLINVILTEKESGVKELMKVVGLEEWLVWISWFLNSLILGVGVYTIVTLLLVHNFNGADSAALRYVHPFVLWCFIILYSIANIAFCFLFCSIFHKTTYGGFVYLMVVLISSAVASSKGSYNLKLLAAFFPPGALVLGFIRIQTYEILNLSFTWSSFFANEKYGEQFSLGFIFVMLMVDILIYWLLTYYISAVNPGAFGSGKSPFFIFHLIPIFRKSESSDLIVNFEGMAESKYLEKVSANMEVAIKINDLRKNFGGVYAVKDLNLKIYKNEITALLGHNGAGKTTTIAMLTGLLKPSGGSIYYKDKINVLQNMKSFRKHLGFCPQENRLFPYLSVINHLVFYGMLKGVSKNEATEEAKAYIKIMELSDIENYLVAAISGGMKRKLCFGIALMGKAEFLILDEPTSGLDVESRRKLWDLLLNMRESRTVLLTTHHMEEADILGDRIAIMNHGSLECHGTSIFLKKVYRTGYQMTITRLNDLNQKSLMNLVISSVPGAELEHETYTEVVYKLPLTESAKFPFLFESLEKDKTKLGIMTIGIACTTLEDVFLKIGGLSIYNYNDGIDDKIKNGPARIMDKKKVGLRLALQQLKNLFLKKFLYTSRNIANIIFRIIVPTLVLMLLLWALKNVTVGEPIVALTSKTNPGYVMVQNNKVSNLEKIFIEYVREMDSEVIYSEAKHIVDGLLKYAKQQFLSFRYDLRLAAEFNNSHTLLLGTDLVYYSAGVAINTYSNIVLRFIKPGENSSILTLIHPVTSDTEKKEFSTGEMIVGQLIWWLILAFFTVDMCDYFNIPIRSERVEGFKHIQLMSKVYPLIYWLSNISFDFLFFILIIIIRLLVFKLVDGFDFVDFGPRTAITLLVFIIFIPAGLLFFYVVSFTSQSKDASYTLIIIFNLLGSIIVLFYWVFEIMVSPSPKVEEVEFVYIALFYFVQYFILIIPPLNFSLIIMKLTNIWRSNSDELNSRSDSKAYLEFYNSENPDGFLREIIWLCIDWIIFLILLYIIEKAYLSKLVNYLSVRLFYKKPKAYEKVDRHVEMERLLMDDYAENPLKIADSQIVLFVNHLKKQYVNLWKPWDPFVAVKDVTFSVKSAQCFGLLGVNGAGKSTTFKILAGELLPTDGDASISQAKLSTDRNKYLAKTGYCAQTNSFIEELTGREMLKLIASLRGVQTDQLKKLVDKWLSILGLEVYQNRKCGSYSGGNKRKLCTAMSLIGDPNVVFLDEPTSGVDPVSRRKLYDVMGQSKSAGQAVVLTSHSMEECEQLCDRLTIMVRGEMKCIGTPQELKQQFAQGFSVQIKFQYTDDAEALEKIKQSVSNTFGQEYCILKDEHKGLLHYQITDTSVTWSVAFRHLEAIKSMHNVIEDYIITDTSLEQVFLSFAKLS